MNRNYNLYNAISFRVGYDIANSYSSSFSVAIKLLDNDKAEAVYSIYGFVRLVDEVVDSWRPSGMDNYIADISLDLKRAIKTGFSTNPVVHAFAITIRCYHIQLDLIDAFIKSMRMDINKQNYTDSEYRAYIYGSAEAVGLMCLTVFVDGDKRKYNNLLPGARALGSAFQKINFLRDFSSDYNLLGRVYFPQISSSKLDNQTKAEIINDINKDLSIAKQAISRLPKSSRFGVELAYSYFFNLTKLVAKTSVEKLNQERLSLPKHTKVWLLLKAKLKRRFTK